MKRKNFLRALGVLVFAPSLLTKLRPLKKAVVSSPIFRDMDFVEIQWSSEWHRKYADKSFIEIMKGMGKYISADDSQTFHFFDRSGNDTKV